MLFIRFYDMISVQKENLRMLERLKRVYRIGQRNKQITQPMFVPEISLVNNEHSDFLNVRLQRYYSPMSPILHNIVTIR